MTLVRLETMKCLKAIYTSQPKGSIGHEYAFTYSGFSCPTILYGLMIFIDGIKSPYYDIRDKARQ